MLKYMPQSVLQLSLVLQLCSGLSVSLSGSAPYAVLDQAFQFTCTVTDDNSTLGFVSFSVSGSTQDCAVVVSSCTQFVPVEGYTCGCVIGQSGVYYLNITSVSLMDDGRWECRRSQTADAMTLPVYYGPYNNLTLDKSSPQIVREAVTPSLTVDCSATCKPCSYTWKKDTQTVSSSRTLSLTSISRNQAGDYICTAVNTATGVTSSAPTLKVTVYYAPDVNLEVAPAGCRPYRVYVGQQNVQLTCQVTAANPTVTSYSWTRDGSSIPSATSSMYSLSPVTRGSAGNYMCAARNSVGTSSSPGISVDVQYPPTVSVPNSQSVVETQTLTVNCTVDSNPTATVTWSRKDGGSLPSLTGSTLTISNIQRSQAGVYVCTATNSLSPCVGSSEQRSASDEVTVDVQYAPDVNLEVAPAGCRPYRVYVGQQNVQLTCQVTAANPTVTSYSWTRDGSSIPSATSSMYSMSPVTRGSAGNYMCAARNSVGTSSSPGISVDVQYPPTVSVPNSQSVVETQTLRVTCTVDSNPTATVTWSRKDGGSLPSQTGSTLTFSNIQRSQAGVYVCTATNTLSPCVGSSEQRSASDEVTVDVQYSPSMSGVPPTSPVTETTTLHINCSSYTVPGNPSTTRYRWTGPGFSSSGPVLTITSITRTASGVYSCTASNTLTQTAGQPQTGSAIGQFHFDVQYSSTITSFTINSETTTVTVSESASVQLACRVDSNPASSIHLLNGSTELKTADDALAVDHRWTADCRHRGNYTCTADNNLIAGGLVRKQVELLVTCPPRLDESVAQHLKHASRLGGNVDVSVSVLAYPLPTFTWSRTSSTSQDLTGSSIPVSDISVTARLHLTNLQQQDFGDYSLTVDNGVGRALTYTVKIVSEGSPEIPTQIKVIDNVTTSSIWLSWQPGFNGGQSQVFILEYRQFASRTWTAYKTYDDTGKMMVVEVTGLKQGEIYSLRISARNKNYDSTDTSYAYVETKTAGVSADPPRSGVVSNGIIAGTVVGTLLLTLLIAGVVVLILYRKGFRFVNTRRGNTNQESSRIREIEEMDNIGYSSVEQIHSPAEYSSLKDESDKQHYTQLKIYENTKGMTQVPRVTNENISASP